MKKILFIAITLMTTIATFGQTFEEGGKYLHFGIGFGSPYALSGAKVGLPPIHTSLEVGVTENVGIGGLIGYNTAKYESSFFGDTYSWKYSYLLICARGAYHFVNFDKADVYVGGMLGYNVVSAKFKTTSDLIDESDVASSSASGVAYGGFLGARKTLGEKVTIFGEIGYSVAWISAGICLNL
ncbi:MAG: hypothetical protein ACKVOK_15395 [Flavobacteriales bacterium]